MTAEHIGLGRAGEDLAAEWYRCRGYRVLARNWRCPVGEIDLVLIHDGQIVVAEVKTRRSDAFGIPALAVDARKQQRLRRLAAMWLAEQRIPRRLTVRFDVVAITGAQIDVYEHAF